MADRRADTRTAQTQREDDNRALAGGGNHMRKRGGEEPRSGSTPARSSPLKRNDVTLPSKIKAPLPGGDGNDHKEEEEEEGRKETYV